MLKPRNLPTAMRWVILSLACTLGACATQQRYFPPPPPPVVLPPKPVPRTVVTPTPQASYPQTQSRPVVRDLPSPRPAVTRTAPAPAPVSRAPAPAPAQVAPPQQDVPAPAPQQQQSPAPAPRQSYVAPAPAPAPAYSGSATNLAGQLDPSIYRLAAGDIIKIDVFNEPDLSVQGTVESTGGINYPLLGRLNAAGLTVRQLEVEIARGLSAGFLVKPDVRVSLFQYRPIFISGQVRRAGSYPYAPGLTVEKALTLAGGMTEFASARRIYVLRENQAQDARQRVDLDRQILPGDTLIVEERLF